VKAVILCAGQGTRLRPLTNEIPKALVRVLGRPIIEYQVDALKKNGISDITLVVGFRASLLREYADRCGLNIIENTRFEKTNNMFSLNLFESDDDVLIMNGDVVFDSQILFGLTKRKRSGILVDVGSYDPESMKVVVKNSRVDEISKEVDRKRAYGCSIDVYRIASNDFRKLKQIMNRQIKENPNLWVEVAMAELLKCRVVMPIDIRGRFWWEVDDKDDLKHASREMLLRKELFLFDVDGTVKVGRRPTPGARAFIKTILGRRKRVVFLTNNSSKGTGQHRLELRRMFDRRVEVNSSTQHMIEYLKSKSISNVYVLGTPSFVAELTNAGFSCVRRDPQAVILSFDKTITYAKIRNATRFVGRGVPFYVTHKDLVCPSPSGMIPDAGSLMASIVAATGKTPKGFGKPSREFAENIMRLHGAKREECVMFGDRLYTDIAMAKSAGICAVLVLTGETKAWNAQSSEIEPDHVIGTFEEIV
jgi:HAD superfamily hydrolase (TIGR01450 family)